MDKNQDFTYQYNAIANNTEANPKEIIVSLSPNTYIFVIKHSTIDTFTDLLPYKITVWTDDTNNGCPNFCKNITHAIGNVFNEDTKCKCKTDYSWNDTNKKCYFSCVTNCSCPTNYEWNTS